MGWMMNGVNLSDDAPGERLAEFCALLAEALMRLQGRKSSVFAGEFGESSLHFVADRSGDAPPCSAEASS
jgi:hypothetical protein